MILVAAKCLVAARLDLFGDEAFYWQCGQRPALAYADHPPVTAMLTRLGTELAGDTPFGVRLVFLVLGAVFPLAVYRLALPLVGRRDAWLAAGASLVVPAFAQLGLVAVPDAVLLPATAVFLLGLERATREDVTGSPPTGSRQTGSRQTGSRQTGAWLLAGLAGALGLATHYRFVLAPAAAIFYLVASRSRRRHWRRRGPWLMLAALLPGLAPSVVYNLRNDFAPVRYYLAGRHGPHFDAGALFEHLAGQALLVTPLLYLALIGVLATLCRRALAGDDRAFFAASFALAYLGLFFLASPFEDSGLVVAHWPLPGYLPLLPYLPGVIRRFAARDGARRIVALLAPALGAAALALVLSTLGTGWPRLGSIREPFIGWSEVSERSRGLLQEVAPAASGRRLVVAGNYKLGAQLEMALHGEADVYVLDHHKNRQHGRAGQLVEWRIGEAGLRRRAGEEGLVVIEATEIRTGEHDARIAHAGSFFEGLEPLGELRIPSTGKRKKNKIFWFYRGKAQSEPPNRADGDG